MSDPFHSKTGTYGSADVRIGYWWFAQRESTVADAMRRLYGGTWVIDSVAPNGRPHPPIVGAVIDDFGNLVPVRRPS